MRRAVAVTGWLVIAGVGALTAVGIVVVVLTSFPPERAPDIADLRACPHSNVELTEVTAHFAIKLPDDATGLRFYSDVHPTFGEYNLEIAFRTTPKGLRKPIADSGFATPKPVDRSQVLPMVSECLAPLTFRRGQVVQDRVRSSRTLVIDTSDPARPLVYIDAADL
jgi:hypothetical protein